MQTETLDRCLLALPEDEEGHSWCRQGRRLALLYGYLLNREALQQELEIRTSPGPSDAELLLAAHERWGADAARKLEGVYAAVVWDGASQTLHCIRDPIGVMPVYYATTPGGLVLSSDLRTLLDHPSVSREVDRLVMAEHLLWRHSRAEETFFHQVRRLPGGHRLVARGSDLEIVRYWDPVPPPGQPIDWLDPAELTRFPELLQQTIASSMALGPAAISLSGGLDSVSVAAVAAEVARTHGWPRPHALSVHFDDPTWDESEIQTRVASALEMPLHLISARDCLEGRTLLGAGVELSPRYPSPLYSLWEPMNLRIAQVAQREGLRVLLTGIGGDEWLGVTPLLAADFIRSGNPVQLWRLYQVQARSFQVSPADAARSVLWQYGGRAVLSDLAHRYFPGWVARRRGPVTLPDWIAPDPDLRRQLLERLQPPPPEAPVDSRYIRDMRPMLQRPLVTMGMELVYSRNQGRGLACFHPYWSRPIAEFTLRTPPEVLNGGGRAKGLVRQMLAERFPSLGFDRQKKLAYNPYFQRAVTDEWTEYWRRWAPDSALAEAGIVHLAALEESLQSKAAAGSTDYFPVWLLAEAWLRGQRQGCNHAAE